MSKPQTTCAGQLAGWAGWLFMLLLPACARADTVTVAVAANFAAPMREIAAAFERQTGHDVRLSTGATGALYAQIVNGAPFELLLAADTLRPEALVDRGLARPADRKTYAVGTLVLWTRERGLDLDGGGLLRSGSDAERIAIASPGIAPYGRAAQQTLERLGLAGVLESRLVMGQNVVQSFQYASTGNARFAFVAASLVYRDGALRSGSAWIVPEDLHAPVRQDAVLLASAAGRPAARALFDFLQSDTALAVLARYGYRRP